MRNRRHNSGFGTGVHSYANNSSVNIINVTNITNVTNVTKATKVSAGYGYPARRRRQKRRDRLTLPSKKAPKLQRFCASGGLLDYDVAARMGEGELCEEAAKVIGYNAKGLARDVSDIGGGLCKAAGCVAGGLFGVLEAFVNAWD